MTESTFRDTLAQPGGWATLVELVPWAGPLEHQDADRHLAMARTLSSDPRVTALTVTDNAGGHVRLSPLTLGGAIADMGADVVVHVSCRDRSRGALASLAYDFASRGLTGVLALSGDYPVEGYRGLSRPVFDIDSVALLALLEEMRGRGIDFFPGVAVNPYKGVEADLVPQLLKLDLKVKAGARFAITQVGWDPRSLDELLRWIGRSGAAVAPIAAVYILGRVVARVFHEGRVPGVRLSDTLMAHVEREAAAPDKGRGRFLDLAAMQVAVARGLGYRGVYLAGQRSAEEVDRVLDRADAYASDWRSLLSEVSFPEADPFRLFEPAADTPYLASGEPSRAYARSRSIGARKRARRSVPIAYKASRMVHDLVFTPGTPGFAAGRRFYEGVERMHLGRPLHMLEQVAKVPMYDCRDCGDCSLPEIAYLCPESQCVKNQRNGPCGGSRQGECEVPGKPCIWAAAYVRLKPYGEELDMLEREPVLTDNALRRTSAWSNAFLGRDHVRGGKAT
jgi:methylenetetrahydrofolate reductase (NADPH)